MGAAIAGLAGAIWAWLNTGIFPEFMNPVRSTFLVWAAFIVGGRGNNRGMIIGAFLIVIVDFFFNVMVVARGGASLPFHGIVTYIDSAFRWFIVDLGGLGASGGPGGLLGKRGLVAMWSQMCPQVQYGRAWLRLVACARSTRRLANIEKSGRGWQFVLN